MMIENANIYNIRHTTHIHTKMQVVRIEQKRDQQS